MMFVVVRWLNVLEPNPMRFQFHIKHLMVVVFVAAVLLAFGSFVVPVAVVGYFVLVAGVGLIYGEKVTRRLQDAWTQTEEDRTDLGRVTVVFRTGLCVLLGMATAVGIFYAGFVLAWSLLNWLVSWK